MNNNIEKEIPSKNIQKEYEENPSYNLDKNRENNNNLISLSLFENHSNNQLDIKNSKEEVSDIHKLYQSEEKKLQSNFGMGFDYSNNNKRQNDTQNKSNENFILFNSIKKAELFNINNCMFNNKINYKKSINSNDPINNIHEPNFLFPQQKEEQSHSNNNIISKNSDKLKPTLFLNNNNNKMIESGNKNIIIYDANQILDKLKDYLGSVFLQNLLTTLDNKEISILLFTILSCINDIMCLEYGNYFFQKFIKKLNVAQRILIYQKIESNFLSIAQNQSGTHSIQSIIDQIETPIEQEAFNKLLDKNMLSLFNDKNAYHIIMKIIIEKPENQRNNVNLFLINNIAKIAINPYGSYCVNKFIMFNNDINLKNLLLKNVQLNIKDFFYYKCSCSILLLLLKYYKINSCEFIFHEVENNLNLLIKYHISYSFIWKIFLYLQNNDKDILNNIISNICNNEDLLNSFLSNFKGTKFLIALTNYANDDKKNFILEKIKNKKNEK